MIRWSIVGQAFLRWLILLLFFFALAHAKRQTWAMTKGDYLANNSTTHQIRPGPYGSRHYINVQLSKSTYLFEQRNLHHPKLEHLILRCEAERFLGYDMYKGDFLRYRPIYHEWPRHKLLVERCLQNFPDDPEILRIAGSMKMIAGDTDEAAEILKRCFEPEIVIFDFSYNGVLPLYFDSLVLTGQESLVEEYFKPPSEFKYISELNAMRHMEYLNQGERYVETIELAKKWKEKLRDWSDYWTYLGEARIMSGRIGDYKKQILAEFLDPRTPDIRDGTAFSSRFWERHIPWKKRRTFKTRFNLSNDVATVYTHDPHLAIIDGRFDIADHFWDRSGDDMWWWAYFGAASWAEAYIASGDKTILVEIEIGHGVMCQNFIEEHGSINWQHSNPEVNIAKDNVTLQLQRCYVKDCNWKEAERMESLFSASDSRELAPDRQEARVLCMLARGEHVDELNLRRLYGDGRLASLVRSKRFATALKDGGISRDQALAELRNAARPWWKGQ